MTTISIILNGENIEIKKGLTLLDLVEQFQLDLKKIAIEKDYKIINFQDLSNIVIDENSKIEIVHFIGGG